MTILTNTFLVHSQFMFFNCFIYTTLSTSSDTLQRKAAMYSCELHAKEIHIISQHKKLTHSYQTIK